MINWIKSGFNDINPNLLQSPNWKVLLIKNEIIELASKWKIKQDYVSSEILIKLIKWTFSKKKTNKGHQIGRSFFIKNLGVDK
jgi:hypothetical protein